MSETSPLPPLRRPSRSPLVSIIIPSYNHAAFLGEAIESVLAQTSLNFEILIIDDGSTDHTGEIAKRYPQAQYLKQANQGLAAARNTGLRASKGDYLIFLDADDRLMPTAIEVGLNCLLANPPCAFVSGLYRLITAEGSPIPGSHREPVQGDHYLAFLRGNYIGMHATVIYRRAMLEEEGGFDIRLRACEDYEVYLRLSRKFPVATHQELVAEYRMHGANMSGDLGLMLRTSLQVLRLQRPNIRGNAERIAAYQQGIREWQDYYTRLMMERLIRLCKTSVQPRSLLLLTAPFLRLAPGTVLGQAAERCWNKARSVFRKVRAKARQILVRKDESLPPQVGSVQFGSLRRLTPISRHFGFDRGLPLDRYYIENFLAGSSADVHGRMLEIGGNDYTLRFGGKAVAKSDVLHFNADNPIATFVGDLSRGENLPSNAFDGIILTQTLHLVYDLKAAVATLHRILKPGGVLLMTVPGTISQLEQGVWANVWYWGFTELSIWKLFAERFRAENLKIQVHGNVLAATAFLQGLAAQELTAEELAHYDPLYPLLITVRAQKQATEDL